MNSHVVIVTGSREWADWGTLADVLRNCCPKLVVQGGCPTGADKMARDWCDIYGVDCRTFRANWAMLGRRAGPDRNRRMLEAYPGARVVAFPLGGPGTADCIRQANKLSMDVFVYPPATTTRA